MQAIVDRDASALLAAGGTILGRSSRAAAERTSACTSMAKKIRCRSRNPSQQVLSSSSRMPLSVVASFRRLVRCHGHKYPTYCVLFDRTGRRMITGSDDFLIKIWCTRTGYLIKTFKGHQGMVSDIALNVENTLLASASTDGSVRIWNLKTGEPRTVLIANPQGRVKSVTGVRFSPSPVAQIRFLAATCETGLCRLYRWHRDTLTFDTEPIVIDARSEPRDNISSFAFNHTGSRLAIATVKGYVSIFSTIADAVNCPVGASGWGEPRLITRIAAHEESITTLVFSSDGEKFLTGSVDGTVKVWRCSGPDLKWSSVTVDVKEPIPLPQDAPEIIAESQDDFVRPTAPIAATTTTPAADNTITAAMLAAATQAAAAVASESATRATEALAELGTLVDSIGSLASSVDLRNTQTSRSDSTAVVSSIANNAGTMATMPLSDVAAADVPIATAPNQPSTDAVAVSDRADAPVELVSDSTRAIGAATGIVVSFQTQPNATAQTDSLVASNNATAGAPPVAGTARVETNQVAWLCDNTRIIASNNVGSVLVIDTLTGKVLWKRRLHSIAEVYVLIPHPTDPRIAISGGYDGRAIIWNTETGDVLHEYKVGEMLFDGSFSEDGLKFALTSDTGAALLFGLGPSWAYDDANRMHEQMFANDYTATIMDENRFVADQQSQIPSYLVPHSPLMDFDGRIYRRQRGTRFGLDIGMGIDEHLFSREDAGRMAALTIELDHAYLDNRAAQAPIAEIQPSRGRRRRGRAPARTATVEEIAEPELPIILPIDDDSDDEEYNAGEEEEEEEDELEEVEEEDDDNGMRRFANAESTGRATRRFNDSDETSAWAANPRDRRVALQLLRNRHNSADSRSQRSSHRRSTARRAVGEEDDDQDGDVNIEAVSNDSNGAMDIDSDEEAGSAASSRRRGLRATRRIRRARSNTHYDVEETAWDALPTAEATNRRAVRGRPSTRNLTRNADLFAGDEVEENGANTESITSDDEFRPARHSAANASNARGGRRRGRPRISRDQADSAAETSYLTRNRRIASDSESGNADEAVSSEEQQEQSDNESDYNDAGRSRSRINADANIDIMPSSDIDSHLPYSSRSQARISEQRGRRRAGDLNGTAASAVSTTRAEAATRTRGRSTRSSANVRRVRDHEDSDFASDNEASMTRTVPGRANERSSHMQVPRSAGMGDLYSDEEPSGSDSAAARGRYADDIYFREGHEDFWTNPSRCKKLSEKLLPYATMPNLSLTVFGKVVDLRYSVGPPTFCTVKIQLLANQSIEELDQETQTGDHELAHRFIQVQYHDCDGVPDFLILYSRYRASLHRSLKIGDSVEVLFDEDQAHSAAIVGFRDIKPTSRQTNFTRLIARNPWKSIVVEWADVDIESTGLDSESRTEMVSPWELVHDDDAAEMEIPPETSTALLRVVDGLREEPDFGWFVKNVDYVVDYPDYLLNIAYPICLDTIYERLQNSFYRHIMAVAFDMELIQQNADTFNDPGTVVPIAAQKLISRYSQLLSQALSSSANDADQSQTLSSSRLRASRRLTSSRRSGAMAAAAVAAVTIKGEEGSSETRRLRKRKAAASTRSTRQPSRRRRLANDSDGSDFGMSSEQDDPDDPEDLDDEEEEEEDYEDGVDENDDDDDALYA
ncbi:hypothetical protein FB639_001261 [Coemansia asiatica]|nr:hypothetical protein FB639_001261 [Coemansia asiatica]